MKNALRLKKI